MNECQRLHETIVRDVYDIMTDVKDFDEVEWMRRKNNTGSIARRASNLILVFPVIVSTSLSIQTASVISKAIERKCVSLLQILFSAMQISSVDNMYDYIKQFHTNLNLKSSLTLDDFIDVVDTLANEGAITITDKDAYEAVKEDMHNINFYLKNEYNPTSLNDYEVRKNMYGESAVILNEKKNDNYAQVRISFDKKYLDTFLNGMGGNGGNGNDGNGNGGGNNNNGGGNVTYRNPRGTERYSDVYKDQVDYFRYQLTQPDVDKANELMPTTMIVNFIATQDGKKIQTSGVIGVKAKLYPVDAMDIVARISSKYKESNGLFNLVRASTREISFFRDLAFAIDKAKLDAVNMARESNNAKIFKVLERRAAKNKFSTLLKKNDASPITSLVLSQDEVEYLKKYSDINMEKSYITRSILEKYNLMDIIIADESLEVAKFLFDDGDGIYEVLPFDELEKQAKDSSYKKVINLMSKLNR